MTRVAALYVLPDGPYANRPDVDLWDEARDARLYAGPYPVVAHPPCDRWCRFAPMHGRIGEDGGCFASALEAVQRWGGVLEHPEGSLAWPRFGLMQPKHGAGWQRGLFDSGWTCSVDQGNYGHRARKRTWLFFSGHAPPPELIWSEAVVEPCPWRGGWVEFMGKRERKLTPGPFCELLLGLARNARSEAAA